MKEKGNERHLLLPFPTSLFVAGSAGSLMLLALYDVHGALAMPFVGMPFLRAITQESGHGVEWIQKSTQVNE